MKKQVDTSIAVGRSRIALENISDIEDYNHDLPALYFVENGYVNDYDGQDVTLYRFEIARQTECYFFLSNGQRVSKKLTGRTFGLTPTEALGKAMERARNYLEILIRRGQNVSDFVNKIEGRHRKQTAGLRDFSKIAESFKDVDDMPTSLMKDFNDHKDTLKDLLK